MERKGRRRLAVSGLAGNLCCRAMVSEGVVRKQQKEYAALVHGMDSENGLENASFSKNVLSVKLCRN